MESSHLPFVAAGVVTAIVVLVVAVVLRCVTKPCATPPPVSAGRDEQPLLQVSEPARSVAAGAKKRQKKRKKDKQRPPVVAEEPAEVDDVPSEPVVEQAAVEQAVPQQLLLGVSGDIPDVLFIASQFSDSGEGSMYGGGLGKDKEEEDEEETDALPELNRPQGYENVATSDIYGAGAGSLGSVLEEGSVYESLDAGGGAVSAYLSGLSSDAVVYEDGNALAGSCHGSSLSSSSSAGAASGMTSVVRVGQLIDWNAMFQETLDLPETSEAQVLHKYERLSSLAHDFVETAQRIGTLIISEAHLPASSKTLLPVNIGGEAGGEKWLSMGILFKFAVDWKHFYGSDARAMKSAGHELKSLMRYYQCEGVRVPLMALIDYRGYRLVAQSVLPISRDTIVYGSNNSGKTVLDSSPECSLRMRRAGEQLNIKGHLCGVTRGVPQPMLWGPTDIEGHLGTDGRFYVIDLARVFPPTCLDAHVKETFLYELMRPEWVAENPVPLSSDAFSGFSSFRMDSIDNREVFESSQRLVNVRVPEFAQWLDTAMLVPTFAKKALKMLTEELHRRGINCRYLGRVRARCVTEAAREVLLVEIVARVVKNLLNERLRVLSKTLKVPGEMPYRKAIVGLLNMVLGHPPISSSGFWNELLVEIQVQFKQALSPAEQEPSFNLRHRLSMYLLLKRLQRLAAVTLSKQSLQELKTSPKDFRVVLPDIEHVYSQVTHMNIVSYAEGMSLYLASKQESGPCGRRLFRLAESKFDGAVRSTPDNLSTLNTYADVLRDRAARAADEDSLALYSKAVEKYRMGRNWAAVASLGHHLVDVCPSHWRCQDVMLSLATACFETVATVGGAAGEVGRRSLGRVMVTRAALRRDAQLYQQAGAIFQADLGALGLHPEDTMWLSQLSAAEVASLAEILNRSPTLSELDTRWLMNASHYCTPNFLLVVLGNCATRLESLTLEFSHQLPTVRVFEDELSPTVFMPSPNMASLQNVSDNVLDSMVIERLAAQLPPQSLQNLTQLTVSRQAAVSDDAFSLFLARCQNLKQLSLSQCTQVGELTYAAIGSHCARLEELNLSGTGWRVSSADLVPACRNLTVLHLAHTLWRSRDDYCAVLGACAHALRVLDMSHVRELDQGVTDFVAANLTALETLRLDGCSYLADACMDQMLRGMPLLASLTLSNDFDLTNATLAKCLLLGGADAYSSKGSWRANHLKELNLAHCLQLTDASMSLLRGHFLELQSINVAGCAVSAPLMAQVIQQVYDCLVLLDISNVRVGSTDLMLDALGKGFPALSTLRVGWSSSYNDSVTDDGIVHVGRGCPNLRELSLMRCRQVTDAALESLARGCTVLEQLDLSYCNFVTSVGLGHLAGACHAITDLRLAHCKLLGEIQCVTVGMPKLTALDLHECSFVSEDALVKISTLLQGLVFLDVVNCRKVTDKVMRAVQSNCPVLLALAIGGANKISDGTLNEFRLKRPNIVIYLHNNNALAQSVLTPPKRAAYRPPKFNTSGSSLTSSGGSRLSSRKPQ